PGVLDVPGLVLGGERAAVVEDAQAHHLGHAVRDDHARRHGGARRGVVVAPQDTAGVRAAVAGHVLLVVDAEAQGVVAHHPFAVDAPGVARVPGAGLAHRPVDPAAADAHRLGALAAAVVDVRAVAGVGVLLAARILAVAVQRRQGEVLGQVTGPLAD